MLPFLQPKKLAATIMASHKVEGGVKDEHKEDEHAPELVKHAEALISAIHAKDATAVADAMSAIMAHGAPEADEESHEG
jgi:hypothetical protein